jgi:hypothetical protein
MVDCAVCRYWSERLEETRTHGRAEGALKQERRLTGALRTHQFGACARRFPDLLRDLVKEELELPDKATGFCDPVRSRIQVDSRPDENGSRVNLREAPITSLVNPAIAAFPGQEIRGVSAK